MDLASKLSACELHSDLPKISIKDITEPAKITAARRVQTRFDRPSIILEIIVRGEGRVTFLPARFVHVLTDKDLEEITTSKEFYVKCTGVRGRSPDV